MTLLDLVKAVIILLGYVVVAPALGFLMADNRKLQRRAFGLLVFMTSWQINKLTLMLDSIDWYRGATKGFEFSTMVVVALGLLIAQALSRKPPKRWIAPGTFLYLLYVAMSWISIFAAPQKIYVWMATLRFLEPVVIYLAAYHFFRDEDDLRVLMKSLSVTLIVQAFVVVKMKYLNHIYQVMGWFEHQNALAMWAYLCGLILLALALGPTKKGEAAWCWGGYISCAIIIESALARASLIAFGIGTVLVILFSLRDRITLRRVIAPAFMGLVGIIGLSFSLKTIMFRFSEDRNQASHDLRVLLIESSKLMLHDSAIGIGWNNYALVINKPWAYGDCIDQWQIERGNQIDPNEAKPQPESHYWLILAETGYQGFISYMLFICVTLWWCYRVTWHYRRTLVGAFLLGLSVVLTLTYVHSTIERTLTQTKNLAMWLILLGIVARLKVIVASKKSAPAGARAATPGLPLPAHPQPRPTGPASPAGSPVYG